jgi:hypothetical protein
MNTLNVQTSGQLDPKLKSVKEKNHKIIPFIIDGCAVSISSTPKGTDEPMKTVKEILLSAYRTRIARC